MLPTVRAARLDLNRRSLRRPRSNAASPLMTGIPSRSHKAAFAVSSRSMTTMSLPEASKFCTTGYQPI